MRLVTVLMLLLGISFSSCKKYALKQPAYLKLHWGFSDQNTESSKVTFKSGYFYLNHMYINGVREEGPMVAIDQSVQMDKIQLDPNSELGLSIDVPVGKYTEFKIKLDIDEQETPSLVLYGQYAGINIIPIRIEWSTKNEIEFSASGFELKKKKNYEAVIGIDPTNILEGISEEVWSQAHVSMENNIPTIVVKDNNNHAIFAQINNNLEKALMLTIK